VVHFRKQPEVVDLGLVEESNEQICVREVHQPHIHEIHEEEEKMELD
jgi:hypothetical protein